MHCISCDGQDLQVFILFFLFSSDYTTQYERSMKWEFCKLLLRSWACFLECFPKSGIDKVQIYEPVDNSEKKYKNLLDNIALSVIVGSYFQSSSNFKQLGVVFCFSIFSIFWFLFPGYIQTNSSVRVSFLCKLVDLHLATLQKKILLL